MISNFLLGELNVHENALHVSWSNNSGPLDRGLLAPVVQQSRTRQSLSETLEI